MVDEGGRQADGGMAVGGRRGGRGNYDWDVNKINNSNNNLLKTNKTLLNRSLIFSLCLLFCLIMCLEFNFLITAIFTLKQKNLSYLLTWELL